MNLKELQELICRESFLAMGYSSPNPPVAAIMENANTGEFILGAHTQKTGSNHAERELYESAKSLVSKSLDLSLSTHNLYVTLQPCTHYGRTPPCRDIILKHAPKKLILGHEDPNPLVQENADPSIYPENGISLEWNSLVREWSFPFLKGFFSRLQKKRPSILFKVAITREGYFSPLPQRREAISSPSSRLPLSMLRAKVDAVMVGPKTIQLDTPALDFRLDTSSLKSVQENLNSGKDKKSLYHPGAPFWDSLIDYSHNSRYLQHHSERTEDYQPHRVFVLGSEEFHSGSSFTQFIEIQKSLGQKHKNSKAIFFTTMPKSFYSEKFLEELYAIPGSNVEFPGNVFSMSVVLESLAGYGVNFLMVEGGNFLFDSIYPFMDETDEFLIVRNNRLSWDRGSSPVFYQSDELENVWDRELGDDIWQLFRKRSEACLQV